MKAFAYVNAANEKEAVAALSPERGAVGDAYGSEAGEDASRDVVEDRDLAPSLTKRQTGRRGDEEIEMSADRPVAVLAALPVSPSPCV